MLETVLVYIEENEQYLLIHKKKKDMNEGKYLGIGGKIEIGESIVDALLRETKEETGLTLHDFVHRANIYFTSGNYQEKMYLFTSNAFSGQVISSNEGDLVWINKNALKSLPMWAGDHYFLNKLSESQTFFEMHLVYEGETLIEVY